LAGDAAFPESFAFRGDMGWGEGLVEKGMAREHHWSVAAGGVRRRTASGAAGISTVSPQRGAAAHRDHFSGGCLSEAVRSSA
jgi:hypothetical protein